MMRNSRNPRVFAIISACVVVLSCLVHEAVSAAAEPVPQLKLPQTEIDFGTLRISQSATRVIPVLNVGAAPLLLRVHHSCSCATVKIENPEIPPGGKTEVEVTYNARKAASKSNKTLYLGSNDPKSPIAKVTLKANVVTRVITEPSTLRFDGIPLGEEYTAEVAIQPGYDESEWSSVRLATTMASVGIKPVARTKDDFAENRWLYQVTVKRDARAGRIFGAVKVFINEESKPAATFRLSGRIEGRFKAQPGHARFYTRPNQPAPAVTIVLSHVAGRPFDLTDIKCDLPFVAWDIDGMTQKDRYELKVSLKDEVPPGKLHRGKLLLTTNEPLQSEISIPVYAQQGKAARNRTSRAP